MSREDDLSLNAKAREAKRGLRDGIKRSRAVIEQYRTRLLAIGAVDVADRYRLKFRGSLRPASASLKAPHRFG